MPVVIGEITSEVALEPEAAPEEAPPRLPSDRETLERLVQQAAERVIELLRLEWER